MGEGSIEGGLLRCPWHGWDFDPLTGKPPGGFDDGVETFPVEVREDGVYVAFPEEELHVRTSSDVMVETLINWGVRWVWGIVGHSNLGFADAMRRKEAAGELGYFGIRHEGAAAFAASAYGKLTGRPAACFAIAGPGATNLLTGLWDAHVDRAPTLALTGQVPTTLIGRGAFQEVDLAAAFGGVAKYTAVVAKDSNFAELASLACKHAILEQGVSHMVFPDDVQVVEAPDAKAGSPEGRITARDISPPRDSLEKAVKQIAEAKRPVFIVGHGARFVMEPVIALAEQLNAPVMTTFKGKGLIADDHPLGCGVLGRSGTPVASWFMNEADLLVVFGASFSNHTGITSYKPIVQVDYDPMMLGRLHSVTVPVWGEIGVTAGLLKERLGSTAAVDQRSDVVDRWQDLARRKGSAAQRRGGRRGALGGDLRGADRDGARGRHHRAWTSATTRTRSAATSNVSGNRVLMSGYLGSIGFGYPAAMGAWAATQESDPRFSGRKVIAVTGDGGFATVHGRVHHGGEVRHGHHPRPAEQQRARQDQQGAAHRRLRRVANIAPQPELRRVRRALRGAGASRDGRHQLEGALAEALAHDGPATVEILADPLLI